MKVLVFSVVLLLAGLQVRTNDYSLPNLNGENKLFIITLDGLRWQEVFTGADSLLLANPTFNAGSTTSTALYWASAADERRKKLMPFFWNVIAGQGKLYGNRAYGNCMNVANPYALSYPGYNELLTGRVDLTIYNNGKAINQNHSLLDWLNATITYKDKVAAFASWDAFSFILNKPASNIFINSGFEALPQGNLTATEAMINQVQEEIEDKKNTRPDELTYLACREYIQKRKPSVVFLSFGGTDEAAHQKQYDQYLQQAANADRMIGELWQYLQTVPEYAGRTTFLITTDHGRGASAGNWHKHGLLVSGSSQTWMALMGPGVRSGGEQKQPKQHYLKDVGQTALNMLSHH